MGRCRQRHRKLPGLAGELCRPTPAAEEMPVEAQPRRIRLLRPEWSSFDRTISMIDGKRIPLPKMIAENNL